MSDLEKTTLPVGKLRTADGFVIEATVPMVLDACLNHADMAVSNPGRTIAFLGTTIELVSVDKPPAVYLQEVKVVYKVTDRYDKVKWFRKTGTVDSYGDVEFGLGNFEEVTPKVKEVYYFE